MARAQNPRGAQWAVVSAMTPSQWPTGPVEVVTRDEAADVQRSRGRMILRMLKDRSEADRWADAVRNTNVQIARPDGTVLYTGPILDVAHDPLVRGLGFVDRGRLFSLVDYGEVQLARGKKALIARRIARANPQVSQDDTLMSLDPGEVWVRVGSHRARGALHQRLGHQPQTYYSMQRRTPAATSFMVLSEAEFERVKGIKGVSRARLKRADQWQQSISMSTFRPRSNPDDRGVGKVPAHKLQPGMIVRAPAWIRDYDTGKRVPLAHLWESGRPPEFFTVVDWDWEGGETYLRADDGTGLDSNVLDYPPMFDVVSIVGNPRTKRLANRLANGG